MTGSVPDPDADRVGLTISGGLAHFPGVATERVRLLADLDPALVAGLLAAAEASAFFTRPATGEAAPARPDARIYHVHLSHAGRTRTLAVPEPFETPEVAYLVRAVRRCL